MLLHITDPLRALYAIRSITTENALIATSIDASRWRRRTPPSRLLWPSGWSDLLGAEHGMPRTMGTRSRIRAGRSRLGVPSPNRRRTVRPAPRSHSSLGEVVQEPVGGALRKPDGVGVEHVVVPNWRMRLDADRILGPAPAGQGSPEIGPSVLNGVAPPTKDRPRDQELQGVATGP